MCRGGPHLLVFPFLFGGTFIEGGLTPKTNTNTGRNFPSFSEGLSLRAYFVIWVTVKIALFPFLFGGTFIEGPRSRQRTLITGPYFPSFSEGLSLRGQRRPGRRMGTRNFPSFSEGLSLRAVGVVMSAWRVPISLPFRRDFH